MCEFISWKEFDEGDVLFLTAKDIYHTTRGKALQVFSDSEDDLIGHGAIDFFFDLKSKGKDKECTDFSTPNNFPPAIVKAIKAGEFRGLGVAKKLLTPLAWAKYEKVKTSAWMEYEKVRVSAMAEYEKVKDLAQVEHEKVKALAWAEYKKVETPTRVEYKKIINKTFWDLFAVVKNRAENWQKVAV